MFEGSRLPARLALLSSLVVVAFVVACQVSPEPQAPPAQVQAPSSPAEEIIPLLNLPDSLKFAVLGDFGTGSTRQYEMGARMAEVHTSFPYELVITVGRRCHFPGIRDKNPARRNFQERAAINAPIQGSAADIIKRAMIRMPDALREAGLKARMLLQVHDELVFEVPEAELEQTARRVKEVMEKAASLSVRLVVDTGTGDNWAAAH